jgi:hypothetical protein
MPDTQSWAWNQDGTTLETWRSVARALCAQRDRFAMVLHTGDMVDYPRTQPQDWDRARSVMQELDACRMPYAVAFGNHDFDNYPLPPGETTLRGDRAWKALVASLAQRPLAQAPSGKTTLHALAPDWFVLSIDFIPSAADLAWIDTAIAERPRARFVALNHHCVKQDGIGPGWCQQLFDRQPRIRIAVSGHWLGPRREAWMEVPRPRGPKLVALYQDYQHVSQLAAWGVVIELEPVSGGVCVWSENVLTGEVTHPAAKSSLVGDIARGLDKRCFDGGG